MGSITEEAGQTKPTDFADYTDEPKVETNQPQKSTKGKKNLENVSLPLVP